jgi:hypothetical protein
VIKNIFRLFHFLTIDANIDCCVNIDKLDITFRAYVNLDVCDKQITIGVENFTRTISLYSFQFTQEDTFSFGGLMNVK